MLIFIEKWPFMEEDYEFTLSQAPLPHVYQKTTIQAS
jgi:hypothetical protein